MRGLQAWKERAQSVLLDRSGQVAPTGGDPASEINYEEMQVATEAVELVQKACVKAKVSPGLTSSKDRGLAWLVYDWLGADDT